MTQKFSNNAMAATCWEDGHHIFSQSKSQAEMGLRSKIKDRASDFSGLPGGKPISLTGCAGSNRMRKGGRSRFSRKQVPTPSACSPRATTCLLASMFRHEPDPLDAFMSGMEDQLTQVALWAGFKMFRLAFFVEYLSCRCWRLLAARLRVKDAANSSSLTPQLACPIQSLSTRPRICRRVSRR